ncbi:MAG: hypothetical protein QM493_04830 [Sulfurovum sp.]
MTIGVSEIQKNISLFQNLTETIHIIDKKTKKVLAMVLPSKKIESSSLTNSLGGILQRKIEPKIDNLESMIADAYEEEMRVKYGQ